MGERLSKVRDMVKKYDAKQKAIQNQYNNKDLENRIAEIDKELKPSELYIQRLEKELSEIPETQRDLIEEYKKKIDQEKNPKFEGEEGFDKDAHYDLERRKKLDEKQKLLEELNNIRKDKNREKNMQNEILDLETKQRAELTQEKMSLDNEIEKVELNMKMTLMDIRDFKYEYEEKDGMKIPKNGDEMRELNDKYSNMQDKLQDLKDARKFCETKLEQFKQKDTIKAQKISEAWYDAKRNEGNKTELEGKPKTEEKKTDLGKNERDYMHDYKNIHLKPDPIIDEEPLKRDNGTKIEAGDKDTKNVFEKANIIEKVKKSMGLSKNNIASIKILEGKNKIYCEYEAGNKKEYDIDEVFENKKELFKKLDIRKKCKEITGKTGLLLMTKLNPEVVKALEDDSVALKSYIKSIYEKKELPFKLTHDLSGLGVLKKISMLRKTRAEERSGARVLGRLFDKNKALEAGKKEKNSDKKDNVMDNYKKDEEMKKKIEKAKEETLKSDKYARVIPKEADLKKTGKVNMDTKYKIDNKGNIVENKAKESYKKAMNEQQEKTAKDVKKIMDEKESSK